MPPTKPAHGQLDYFCLFQLGRAGIELPEVAVNINGNPNKPRLTLLPNGPSLSQKLKVPLTSLSSFDRDGNAGNKTATSILVNGSCFCKFAQAVWTYECGSQDHSGVRGSIEPRKLWLNEPWFRGGKTVFYVEKTQCWALREEPSPLGDSRLLYLNTWCLAGGTV